MLIPEEEHRLEEQDNILTYLQRLNQYRLLLVENLHMNYREQNNCHYRLHLKILQW